jgi:hypothetical protein
LVDERFTPPHEVNASIPGNLSQLVMECIRTNPSHRPADTHELIRRLDVIRYTLERDTVACGSTEPSGMQRAPIAACSPVERGDNV